MNCPAGSSAWTLILPTTTADNTATTTTSIPGLGAALFAHGGVVGNISVVGIREAWAVPASAVADITATGGTETATLDPTVFGGGYFTSDNGFMMAYYVTASAAGSTPVLHWVEVDTTGNFNWAAVSSTDMWTITFSGLAAGDKVEFAGVLEMTYVAGDVDDDTVNVTPGTSGAPNFATFTAASTSIAGTAFNTGEFMFGIQYATTGGGSDITWVPVVPGGNATYDSSTWTFIIDLPAGSAAGTDNAQFIGIQQVAGVASSANPVIGMANDRVAITIPGVQLPTGTAGALENVTTGPTGTWAAWANDNRFVQVNINGRVFDVPSTNFTAGNPNSVGTWEVRHETQKTGDAFEFLGFRTVDTNAGLDDVGGTVGDIGTLVEAVVTVPTSSAGADPIRVALDELKRLNADNEDFKEGTTGLAVKYTDDSGSPDVVGYIPLMVVDKDKLPETITGETAWAPASDGHSQKSHHPFLYIRL